MKKSHPKDTLGLVFGRICHSQRQLSDLLVIVHVFTFLGTAKRFVVRFASDSSFRDFP